MRLATLIAAAATLATATVALGCGDSDDSAADRRAVAVAVERLQRAFADGDVRDLCARMTGRAIEQAGKLAHGSPRSCEPDLRRARRILRADRWARVPRRSVRAVDVDGDEATATVAVVARGVEVPLERVDGRWKLDSFFGTSPLRVRAKPSLPSATGGEVSVSFRQGSVPTRCGRFLTPYPTIAGGCEMNVRGGAIDVLIQTPFGSFPLGRCRVTYMLKIDGGGRTWTRDAAFQGGDGCGDVRPCFRRDGLHLPWRGRIDAGRNGGLSHRTTVCVNTCVGFYEGELATRLVRHGRGWQIVADEAGVGRSGFTMSGRFSSPDGAIGIAGEESA